MSFARRQRSYSLGGELSLLSIASCIPISMGAVCRDELSAFSCEAVDGDMLQLLVAGKVRTELCRTEAPKRTWNL